MKHMATSAVMGIVAAVIVVMVMTPKATQNGTTPNADDRNAPNAAYERVMKTGILRCGYTSWAPVAFLKDPNTNEFSGFIPDYLALMAKNLNLKIEYVEDAGYGPQVIEGLKTGRFDAFCTGFNKNAPRGREVFFTDTIFYAPVYAYAKPTETRFDTNLDLINDPSVILSVMDGEATDMIAKNMYPKAKTFALPQNSEMSLLYSNVAQGKADVVFSDPLPAEAYNKNNPDKPLRRINDKPVMTYTIGIAVDNDEAKLVSMLNQALMELQASGQIKATIKKYDPAMDGFKTGAFVFDVP
jgi:ABC-type amino acid transport substrate-binding protein